MLDATAYATHRVYQWRGRGAHAASQLKGDCPADNCPAVYTTSLRRSAAWRRTEWRNVVSADLGELLRSLRRSAFRLEALDRYTIPGEEAWLEAFHRDGSMPDLTPETYPWLQLVADATAAGRTVQRVRILGQPPSEYVRWELGMYRLLAAAGEDIRIADRHHPELDDVGPDFWLFDDTTVAVMRYDAEGRYRGAEAAEDATPYRMQRDLALSRSVNLDAFLGAGGTR
jgi:hypothetical protein